jgi:hypothetical protein
MDELISALDHFVSGEDSSYAAANRIKDLIFENFPEDPYARQVALDLSRYQLGDDDPTYGTSAMRRRLAEARKYLVGAI